MNNKISPFGTSAPIGFGTPNHTILVKFFFTNPKYLPDLPQQPTSNQKKSTEHAGDGKFVRPDNVTMDNRHAREAYQNKYGELAKPSRIRENRVDTGTHFINDIHTIHAGLITRGLANTGYKMTECHWFLQKGQFPSGNKWVVVIAFSLNGEPLQLNGNALLQRRALANTCWSWCHGWENKNGVITLNFGGRLQETRPKNTVIIRNRKVTAASTKSFIQEEDETDEVSSQLVAV